MDHSFDIDVAVQYGVTEAVLIRNFQYWILKNKANDRHFHDGHYWTYNSQKALTELFPYKTRDQLRRAIDDLVEKGVLLKGNYNVMPTDRTIWYAFGDEQRWLAQNSPMQLANLPNGIGENAKAIPNNIPNINNNIPTNACAKDIFFAWINTSDMPEFIQRTFMRFGIPIDTGIDPYLHAFLDNSIQDRELTMRNERYSVLKHFENWLPRYIEAKQREYDNARNQSTQRGREDVVQERPPVYPT